jgi:hypothetical protein
MNTKITDNRIPALIRFASAITFLNIIGHLYLGFEQSYAHVFTALFTAYVLETIMEYLSSKAENRNPVFLGGFKNFILFLLPAHITALAVSMLTFTNSNLKLIVFGVAVAILSKYLFKVIINGKSKHFLNPSNTGIAILFILFPQVGPAPPYQFSEATVGYQDWLLVIIFTCLGSFLNYKFTKKIPLILAWLFGFFLQAIIRTQLFETSTVAALGPMTGIAFLLFTFYMISDPATTPFKFKNQLFFGFSVAFIYGILMSFHIVFGLFFSLLIVCSIRGLYFYLNSIVSKKEIKNPFKIEVLKTTN